ncbi:hypothetical protein JCM5353_008659 [Sporobolomyces roseus]
MYDGVEVSAVRKVLFGARNGSELPVNDPRDIEVPPFEDVRNCGYLLLVSLLEKYARWKERKVVNNGQIRIDLVLLATHQTTMEEVVKISDDPSVNVTTINMYLELLGLVWKRMEHLEARLEEMVRRRLNRSGYEMR